MARSNPLGLPGATSSPNAPSPVRRLKEGMSVIRGVAPQASASMTA
jgi:hypothetical protein